MTSAGRQLASLAQAIAAPTSHDASEGEVFFTLPIPGSQCHLLGRDYDGLVAVLISIDTSFPLGPIPPVRLESLGVTHASRCVVSRAGESPAAGVFSVVRCLSNDPALNELFINVMASVSQLAPKPLSTQQAAQTIDRVIRLFRDLDKPSERTVQGLWSEMFVIANSRDPMMLAKAWRCTTFDVADIACAQQKLEVKSTSGSIRSHSFSAEQLRVPSGTFGVIASLHCQRSAGGLSVGEIWSMVRRLVAVDPSVQLAVDGIVAATLGKPWKEALSIRYDWHVAKNSLRFYSMAAVPAVGVEALPDVSQVRFRSDLTRCAPLDSSTLRQGGSLFEAII
jgi:hypothetical protein